MYPPERRYPPEGSIGVFVESALSRRRTNANKLAEVLPSLSCKMSLGQHIGHLQLGVDVPTKDSRIGVDPLKKPIQINTVSTRDML